MNILYKTLVLDLNKKIKCLKHLRLYCNENILRVQYFCTFLSNIGIFIKLF